MVFFPSEKGCVDRTLRHPLGGGKAGVKELFRGPIGRRSRFQGKSGRHRKRGKKSTLIEDLKSRNSTNDLSLFQSSQGILLKKTPRKALRERSRRLLRKRSETVASPLSLKGGGGVSENPSMSKGTEVCFGRTGSGEEGTNPHYSGGGSRKEKSAPPR